MFKSRSDLPLKTIKIKQDKKISSRHVSREMSMANSSVETYYGGSCVAIPFMWESQPGTPKARFRETPLPPLTPPPSFHSSPAKKPIKKQSKSSLLPNVLPKLITRKNHSPTSPASSSSSSPWSTSHSVPSSPFTPSLQRQVRNSSVSSSSDSRIDEEDKYGSPVSTLCFGITRSSNARSRGCSSGIIKEL